MTRKHLTQLAPNKSDNSNVLQRAAVYKNSDKVNVETQANEQSRFNYSFAKAPVQTTTPLIIQPKLKIGAVGDKYEQEAHRVAAQVVNQINAPAPQTKLIQRQEILEDEEMQMKPMIQTSMAQGNATVATPNLETSINQARGSGQALANTVRQPMERAFGADFSQVRVHTDTKSHKLNQSIQAKAFTVGQNIFFRQGAYKPDRGGQELIAHELTHVVQQEGSQIQAKPTVPVSENSLQALQIQRTPEDVWNNADNLSKVNEKDAKYILKMDFHSNWFLAKDYLIDMKWKNKTDEDKASKSSSFKRLMETLLELRKKETIDKESGVLKEVRNELKKKEPFIGMKDEDVLDWGSVGSESLTSDIDVNLKGAGSIQAVGLFNKLFKTQLGWALEPGTVYDVNVYARDFMTPSRGGKPFNKDNETITPVQEVEELNAPAQTESIAFEAFALNQDVWSLVKMRIYMSDSEWNAYRKSMLKNITFDGSNDAEGRKLQIERQIEDAKIIYEEYKKNLNKKNKIIENNTDNIYNNMRQVLFQGKKYLSKHQQEASKKMMAANLIYEEKLKVVTDLRQELQKLQKEDSPPTKIKEVGIKLKNALSESILYANEAYLTQGAVHFSVIGQQIDKGQSKLIMSEEEYLHSFREQVGDTLKVLNEYEKADIKKAILKAGKYIDRMAKSAIPLIKGNESNDYKKLANVGAAAAQLKADTTKLEDLQASPKKDYEELKRLKHSVPMQEISFGVSVTDSFKDVSQLRETVIAVGKQVEKDFRQYQFKKNTNKNMSQSATPPISN